MNTENYTCATCSPSEPHPDVDYCPACPEEHKVTKVTKEQKIKALAETLRSQLATKSDLERAMTILFKGRSEVQTDNEGQLMVYTGHSYGMHTGDVTCMETKEFLDGAGYAVDGFDE